MPVWAWVLSIPLALMSLLALALLLLRFHYFLEWRGAWTGTLSGTSAGALRIETGFLWYKHVWEPLKDKSWSVADLFTDDDDDDVRTEKVQAPDASDASDVVEENSEDRKSSVDPDPETGFSERAAETVVRPATPSEDPLFLKAPSFETSGPQKREARENGTKKTRKSSDPYRKQRALFRLFTDPDAWKLLGHYGLKVTKLFMWLLNPRIEAAVGHPDPAFLGRVAGKWYAARPFLQILPFGRTELYFRFQDRSPSLWVRVQGRFSGLGVVAFGVRLVVAFPFILFAGRAIHGWRRHHLTGWRAWVYRKLQAD